MNNDRYIRLSLDEIQPLEIIAENKSYYILCRNVVRNFLTKGTARRSPLKGFLFEGPPGTGKTELVKQIAQDLKGLRKVELIFVDGASIASPRWGEAEEKLRELFDEDKILAEAERVILLFDDIESLLLTRSSEISKEWHFSINAVLFHCLDNLDPSRIFVFATTNRPDLIDDALRDRLYSVRFAPPSMDSLLLIGRRMLDDIISNSETLKGIILKRVSEKLKEKTNPSIRDLEKEIVIQCIESGAWYG